MDIKTNQFNNSFSYSISKITANNPSPIAGGATAASSDNDLYTSLDRLVSQAWSLF